MSDPSRGVAYDVLRAADERDAYVNLLLPQLLRERGIVGRDAAFATELVHGTLRLRGTYDAVLDSLVGRPLDPEVRDVLRLGAHQALSMRVPSHAAVSTSVSLVRRVVGHKPAGLVNAVLRKVAADDLDTWVERLTEGLEPDDALAVRRSHPVWVVRALRSALRAVDAADELDALLEADNRPPKVTLVARPGLVDASDLPGTPGQVSPYARVLDAGDPGDVPAVRDGRAGVQDEGSQMVALTLAEAALEGSDARWLDLCAGPGGKAALLGALAAQRGAHLVANEVQPHRAELVRRGLRALPDVEVTVHDGREGPWEPGSFDRVLVDAPCTGLGALRRRPESRWRRTPEDLASLVPLQRALLRRAVELSRPGGLVGYATCSPLVDETIEVVESVGPGVAQLVGVHRWWPHRDGTDAMFLALLRRR
ncbi:16S rRNA (cytosine967-C5)-methyltransferase [Aeromicrobium sp. SORGH_AS981]|uniref:RsmB/NOP family class I SAM-dependent RNA methyltransferase n=1 Tax=Aeromicrobium sp. SORGH_AS_0981 TaxID=3041802 RepID=UPI0028617DBC|nr:transcription antitermination factor NusB [Aeromicrobium sp. SORGH_AS_0981]MDR6119613.1 16S rRNA (cytosine967-C5)-methyltransferase [Aeromicrobium sp. SORGH_AS_0981]